MTKKEFESAVIKCVERFVDRNEKKFEAMELNWHNAEFDIYYTASCLDIRRELHRAFMSMYDQIESGNLKGGFEQSHKGCLACDKFFTIYYGAPKDDKEASLTVCYGFAMDEPISKLPNP